uniref:Glycoside hydrolase family 31 TIM barrel domain-containing protein n=1 Tax=Arion vulgaris TaxID=1028688 RepID=A0A0B7B0J4_9EUPU
MGGLRKKSNKRVLIIVVSAIVMAAVIVAVVVPLALLEYKNRVPHSDGIKATKSGLDCYPEAEGNRSLVDKSKCTQRGCLFNADATLGQPICQYTEKQYTLSLIGTINTILGFQAILMQAGQSPFQGDIIQWTFTFENRGNDLARFTLDSGLSPRYKVPIPMNIPTSSGLNPQYQLRITNNESFAFQIIRKSTGTVIWDIGLGPGSLILSDQFLQISSKLPSSNVYGLGEHEHNSFRHELNKTWPSFSRDQPPSWDAEANLYGVHPFYTCLEDLNGSSHGILLLNSNAQEYAFTNLPSITFRTIGGILDFYIFMGPSPEQVIQQYTQAVGRPVMPPYWSLGFQLCRYGYNNISNLKEAVKTTALYDIPHDVQYVDIDHMDKQKIFTVSQDRFPGLNEYFKELQQNGMRIIYILDPCMISNDTNYLPYEEIKKIGGNIKWAKGISVPANSSDSDGAILGYVWPQGKTVFADFMKTTVKQVWKKLIVDYRNNLTFDGLWIDMNEPANFGTNEERPFNWPVDEKPYWSLNCTHNSLEDPPYRPKAVYRWDTGSKLGRLSDKTICMSTVQGNNDEYSHYDVHSLYGWSQTDATLEAARLATSQRSIVISRSTFPGSGRYAGHWLGDNVSQWSSMRKSIIGLLEFNLFGIPYIGADICGFFDNTTVQLCKRWMQLGAFYTFSRNHNSIGFLDQAPGQLGDVVGYASRDIMRIRYQFFLICTHCSIKLTLKAQL